MTSTAQRSTAAVLPEFKNCPLTDFNVEANRQAQATALKNVESALGKTYPLIMGGEQITTGETFAAI